MDFPQDKKSWMDDALWYKDAIIYELHVKAFFDANDDGIGDFAGLIAKLDYIQDLGVNTIWLLPFYPSPMRDDGYDIADYRNVFPAYGSRKDVREFIREAHERGLKVITELVINHTSDQHPWFQAARLAPPGSAKRNFYVWSDTVKKFQETRIIFTDTETSNWAWDDTAKAYYWHRFFSHQPDLNHNNPEVVRAVTRVMRFWLDMGVDGLRLDAIPYLCVREGTSNENLPETHAVIKQMRAVVDAHYQGRMFLAEANQWPEDVRDYFGDGDECHVAYHFPLMPRMYMAVAQEDRHPIVEIMDQTPDIPNNCQWAIFLRNHDELTLEMVTDKERDYMYETYAIDPRMRINLGIRRRLAPLMQNDPDKIKLMNCLLLSMPGSPIIYYGDELGMGDNIYLGDRNGVRTPMQWSPDRNGGFSRSDPQRLYLPPIMDAVYGFQAVNVEAQSRDPGSLLNWMRRIIAVRKNYKAFGRGSLEFLHPGNRKILAFIRQYEAETILCVANLSRNAQPVELDLSRFKGRIPVELMGRTSFPAIGELPYLLTLSNYGVYWFVLATQADVPSWHSEVLPPKEPPILVIFGDWQSFFPEQVEITRRFLADRLRHKLEKEVLPDFLAVQRWFSAKSDHIQQVSLGSPLQWSTAHGSWLLVQLKVQLASGNAQTYFLPLSLAWGEAEDKSRALLQYTIARVRQRAKVGVLRDALFDEQFCRSVIEAIKNNQQIKFSGGEISFSATSVLADSSIDSQTISIRRPTSEGTNSAIIIDNQLFLKVYRQVNAGCNPELEMGRFLTEASPCPYIIPVAGAVEYRTPDGSIATLALLQRYVGNQGDMWSYTQNYLERALEAYSVQRSNAAESVVMDHSAYALMAHRLGMRTGELHRALAKNTGNSRFDPEPITAADLQRLQQSLLDDVALTYRKLTEKKVDLYGHTLSLVENLLEMRSVLEARIGECLPLQINACKIRHHGDYHLGQVLLVENDFVIVDFEGEPARSLAERCQKHPALRDVAGMLRSFNYAAYTALYKVSTQRADDPKVLEPFVQQWEQLTKTAFLAGYKEIISATPAYPEDPLQAEGLLEGLVFEKALYELRYELDNRPDWAPVPLTGILSLLHKLQ